MKSGRSIGSAYAEDASLDHVGVARCPGARRKYRSGARYSKFRSATLASFCSFERFKGSCADRCDRVSDNHKCRKLAGRRVDSYKWKISNEMTKDDSVVYETIIE